MTMKPDSQAMTKSKLQDYVLAHRDDDEAFQVYMDQLSSEENRVKSFPLKSLDDLANYPEVLEQFRRDAERRT